jgi:hypothetical protein
MMKAERLPFAIGFGRSAELVVAMWTMPASQKCTSEDVEMVLTQRVASWLAVEWFLLECLEPVALTISWKTSS